MDSTEMLLVKPFEYGQYWKGFDETFLIWTVLKYLCYMVYEDFIVWNFLIWTELKGFLVTPF
jgi:hypothetical protein